jgi:hypothetical protein
MELPAIRIPAWQAYTQYEPAECPAASAGPASSYRAASGLAGLTGVQSKTIFTDESPVHGSETVTAPIEFRPWSNFCISITLLICRVAGRWRLLHCIVNTGFSNTTEIESFYCADK